MGRSGIKGFFRDHPVAAVLLLEFLCLAPFMALRDVTPANELRYLSIADEAIRNGNVFTFYNHGEPYADKPPLYFWLIMLCRLAFGRHCIFALSLLSFIPAAVVTCVMDRWVFGALGGESARKRSCGWSLEPQAFLCERDKDQSNGAMRSTMALMLASTLYWLSLGVFLRMDMLLAMFIVLALYAWHRDRPWLFALFTFLGLFTKGLVGLLMPLLTVLVYSLTLGRGGSGARRHYPGRFIGWRFLLLAGGLSAIWFTCVYLEGGRPYLQNLLFHQTVDRTVDAFHHKEPWWFYLVNIWPYMLPWCLLTVTACIVSLCRRGGTASPSDSSGRTEKAFRCAFFSTVVLLSCSSSKLPVYLLPVFPFAVYLLPLFIRRTGWKRWMGAVTAASAILFAMLGVALACVPLLRGRIAALAPYDFASSPLFALPGVILAAGGTITAVRMLRLGNDLAGTRPLAVAILAVFLSISPLLPRINEFIGWRALCSDVPQGEKVYVRGHNRPENMDVFLGRDIIVVGKDDQVPPDGVFIAKSSFSDPSLEGRERRVHGESTLWLPRRPRD